MLNKPATTLDACRALCQAWLRPVVRVCLGYGLKYQDFTELTKSLFIEEAMRESRQGKKINISQMASKTGLQRKDLTERLLMPVAYDAQTERSWPVQVFSQWRQWVRQDASKQRLPLTSADENQPSFAGLARLVSKGTIHHRAVLNELLRLKLVREEGDEVYLLQDAFVPSADLQWMMSFAADNGHDHLQAMTANVLGVMPRFFEQAVFSAQIRPEDCEQAQQLLRQYWQKLEAELLDLLTKAEYNTEQRIQQDPTQPLARLRVGAYCYHTAQADDPAPQDASESALKISQIE
ncbi:DUF6502 family protein [Agitococcus lubricus]|uniref:Uncharacterized protein n=1 Tax=Agitococcus lubricus TaxID=1077255 RepID=A0A2T5IY88_9GAMM|nr:DUF6502 family protein [Agitococcus lubricus]PTQ88889.1 hypothetical protein C8N29_11038 [Agitococcus lubricus]